jgi:uncharacterized membrane protein
VRETLRSAGTNELTADLLYSTEYVDSDGDGWTNGEEIAAGSLPGDPASFPTGAPAQAHPPIPPMKPPASPLIPMHSFHPIIVHFAFALFIFGGLVELVGILRLKQSLREAGFLDMAAGNLAALAAVATGLTAVYRNGFPLRGVLLAHMALASSATVAMTVTTVIGLAAARSGRPRESRLYLIGLLLALMLVSAAGYFGGVFVYD